jgi:Tol biopolymer transport system component
MLLRVLGTLVGAVAVVGGACILVNSSLASSEGVARADRRLASHGTQRIAFDVTGKDDWGAIYTMWTDGSGLRRFRYDGDHAALSPDGRRIVFTSVSEGLFVASLDGRGRRLVPGTEDIYSGGARWSPDGRSVVVASDGDLGIYPVGGGEHRFVNDRAYAEDPDWSPDGRRIAYSARHSFGAGPPVPIQVVSSSGGEPKILTRPPRDAFDTAPRWSPDGKWVLYTRLFTRSSSVHRIYVIASTGGKPRLLRNNASSGAWSPDGTRIAYADGKGRIHVFELAGRGDRTLDVRPCRNPSFETGYCDNLDWR